MVEHRGLRRSYNPHTNPSAQTEPRAPELKEGTPCQPSMTASPNWGSCFRSR